jgi:hypothetical protein
MRQNSVDFQNKELRTNILALLLVTTRRVTPDDIQRHQEQTAIAPLNQCDGPAATRANILELGKDIGGAKTGGALAARALVPQWRELRPLPS